jgi:nucleotide-binding universal stress UspA family protein
MTTTKSIIVPTDFSDHALKAVQYAAMIAAETGSRIVLFHAVSLHLSASIEEPPLNFPGDFEKVEQEQLIHLKHQLQKRYPRVEIDSCSKTGFPVEGINEIAAEKNAWMIIMGTRGANGLKELLVGSNTSSLIQHTEVPVLAIPDECEYNGIKKIVFATNMQKDDIRCLKKIIEYFGHASPVITLLHVEEGKLRDPEAALQSWFHTEVLPVVNYTHLQAECINETDIVKSLDEYLRHNKTDLLVTATRKRNLIERIFDRSITRKLIFHTHIPLLAMHTHASKGEMIL